MMNSKIRAYRFLQWMMRTPILGKDQVLSKEHPQVVMLKKAFDQHAADARAEQSEIDNASIWSKEDEL